MKNEKFSLRPLFQILLNPFSYLFQIFFCVFLSVEEEICLLGSLWCCFIILISDISDKRSGSRLRDRIFWGKNLNGIGSFRRFPWINCQNWIKLRDLMKQRNSISHIYHQTFTKLFRSHLKLDFLSLQSSAQSTNGLMNKHKS